GAPSYHMCWYTTSSSRPWNRSRNGTGPSTPVTSTAPSSSTIGSRRRAAAIASPSRVCAFSRTSSSSRAACQVARSTTGGLPGRLPLALPGVVVMVSSAISSRALAGSLGTLLTETTLGTETHRVCHAAVAYRSDDRAGDGLRPVSRERDRGGVVGAGVSVVAAASSPGAAVAVAVPDRVVLAVCSHKSGSQLNPRRRI